MLRHYAVARAFGALATTLCFTIAQAPPSHAAAPLSMQDAADRAVLALRWAPIHYQDVDPTGSHSLGGAADYITRYDYDGDLDARNNWDHAGNAAFPLAAYVYFSAVETSTHWFLVYLFFHPRDWTDSFFDTEHENDAEGLLLTIKRDGSPYGVLKSAVTVAHSDFYSYTPTGSDWGDGNEDIDGRLSLQSDDGEAHPVTAQQSKGHGLKAWPYYDIAGGDGVIYFPSATTAGVPSGPNDRHVPYRLVDIFEPAGMWEQRYNSALFEQFGAFAGDSSGGCGSGAITCTHPSAHAPWAWDDGNDGPGAGALATDPARLVIDYFQVPEPVSLTYTFNPYR